MTSVFIGGSRSITIRAALEAGLEAADLKPSRVITGGSSGVDALVSQWASERSMPLTVLSPDWKRYGGRAERIFHEEAIGQATTCLVIWDGFSQGSAGLITVCAERKFPLTVFQWNVTTNDGRITRRFRREETHQ